MATTVGTVYVDVKFNVGDVARQLQAQLGRALPSTGGPAGGAAAALERTWTQSFAAIGASAANLGRQMSVALTVPLVALGRAAVSTFNEFDASMTQISALNAVPIQQTEQWRGEVRDLGLEYGIAGEEAAKGLYFITSSGVEASDAMGVLETSTKAAAVGLGETKVVADVVTSALSAYGAANQSAAKTGDQLVAAVRYGKGEANELAGALSQVIPIAANVGVEFGEVAGAMAAMTLSGTSADQAATQLRGLFNTLQDMPPIAQKALKQYTGLDYEQVRMNLSAKGLIPTLKEIYDGFGDNKVAIAEVFGNIRAMTGIMNLFGKNTEHTIEVIDGVTNATGDLNKAWDITAQSKSKQLDIAMTKLHDTLIGLGADIVPALTPVVGAVGYLGEAFGNLPGPLRSAAAALGMLAAAAGPAMWAFGKMAEGVGAMGDKLKVLGPQLRTMNTNFMGVPAVAAAWAGALALVVVAYQQIQSYQADVLRMQEELVKGGLERSAAGSVADTEGELGRINTELDRIDKYAKKWQEGRESWNPLASFGAFKDTGEAMANADAATGLVKLRDAHVRNLAISKEMTAQRGIDRNAALKWLATEALAGRTYATAEIALNAYNVALHNNDPAALAMAESTKKATTSLDGLLAAAKESSDAFFGLRDAEKKRDDAIRGRADAIRKVGDAEQGYRDAQQRTIDANQKIVDSQRKVTEASEDLREARVKLTEAEQKLQELQAGPTADERLDVQSAQLALQRAQGKGGASLDKQQKQLDIRRAQMDLRRAQGAHAENIKEAERDVEDARRGVADAVQAETDAQRGVADARRAAADAQRDQARAYEAIDIAQRGVADAETELFDATTILAGKQAELEHAIATSATSGDKFLEYLELLKTQYPDLARTIDDYIRKFKELRDAQAPPPKIENQGQVVNVPGQGDFVVIPGIGIQPVIRAAGGPLSAGQLSTVNERGVPELWSAGGKQYLLPTNAGQVTPLKPVVNIEAKGHDGVTIGGDIIVQGAESPVATAYEVRRQLRMKSRTKGRT
jgi:TP901 family phage tail tape measure protein